MSDKKNLSNQQWKEQLTEEQYEVCRNKGTEPPFSGEYVNTKDSGTYRCLCCGNALFHSDNKFDSGTGWPSFWEPIGKESVSNEEDLSRNMVRTEVICKHCDSHLGHVFEDGPQPTGLRYCINSVAIKLEKDEDS
ncbi:MAG: Peptide methionine sulfoxide reductase MsrB [Deltaproteobacteria bacterium]|jgi:peptide-methionine (R)-S-oxide reductase|nr:Peptide methionine sulfoxide reductase MsrB [Deltaproteobacteria bacterium]